MALGGGVVFVVVAVAGDGDIEVPAVDPHGSFVLLVAELEPPPGTLARGALLDEPVSAITPDTLADTDVGCDLALRHPSDGTGKSAAPSAVSRVGLPAVEYGSCKG